MMRSKANVKTHPLHAILVVFPIAFLSGTLVFDLLGLLYAQESFGQTAGYLNIAGIACGLLAAVPGIIDYIYTVPPNSSAKDRATKHALINVSVLILFTVIYLLRNNNSITDWLMVILEVIGVVFMMIAGWLGGTLVHRNQIGVDIRYANAGKWKEAYFNTTDKSIEIGKADTLDLNQMMLIHLNGQRIVIGRSDSGYVAFDDRCSHKGGSLAGGSMICGTVQCPWHGSQFNVNSGAVVAGPAKEKISTYTVQETQGKLFL
jgi:uncharacterized membrane protein/nitrite reductase/ring-hydroxylating ferredoxin subunit